MAAPDGFCFFSFCFVVLFLHTFYPVCMLTCVEEEGLGWVLFWPLNETRELPCAYVGAQKFRAPWASCTVCCCSRIGINIGSQWWLWHGMATLISWAHSSHTCRSLSFSVPSLLYFVQPAVSGPTREEGTGNVPPIFLFVLSHFLDLFSDPFFLQKGDKWNRIFQVLPLYSEVELNQSLLRKSSRWDDWLFPCLPWALYPSDTEYGQGTKTRANLDPSQWSISTPLSDFASPSFLRWLSKSDFEI